MSDEIIQGQAFPVPAGDSDSSDLVPSQSDEYTKLFRALLPEAAKQVKRILKNSQNEKMVLMAAHDIFDRAGASKKGVSENRPVIEIKDSNVQLLVQAAKEALE